MLAVTELTNFYGETDPQALIVKYGSPLYVYNERILRQRCREMKELVSLDGFRVNYSTKANANLELLKIIRSEGLDADAMSPGEIYVLLKAGFKPEQILFIPNNVSDQELQYAIDQKIKISVDSLSQLERLGRLNPGGEVVVRFNPGVGAGHHEKVVTGGPKTKFGVSPGQIAAVKELVARYRLKLTGINQHIGSLFLEEKPYLDGVKALLAIAVQFEGLSFVDFGGGFGIPYRKQESQARLDLTKLGTQLTGLLSNWRATYNPAVEFKIEPGRYLVAESGVLLGTVYARKENGGTTYIGTDLGFNVLIRPALYDSHHDLEVYRNGKVVSRTELQPVTVVGNICETGDIMAKERELPLIEEGDLLGVMDAGGYGYVMSSNYNNRLRPAEVLIDQNGDDRLIRRRETFEDLVACCV